MGGLEVLAHLGELGMRKTKPNGSLRTTIASTRTILAIRAGSKIDSRCSRSNCRSKRRRIFLIRSTASRRGVEAKPDAERLCCVRRSPVADAGFRTPRCALAFLSLQEVPATCHEKRQNKNYYERSENSHSSCLRFGFFGGIHINKSFFCVKNPLLRRRPCQNEGNRRLSGTRFLAFCYAARES